MGSYVVVAPGKGLRLSFQSFVFAHRLYAKRALAAVIRLLPHGAALRLKSLAEMAAFWAVPQYQGDTLPPIFHYWSNRHLAPRLQRLGYQSPEDMYFVEIVRRSDAQRPLQILSLGSGCCALEIALAVRLKAAGIAVHLECLDLNLALIRAAELQAAQANVLELMSFRVVDCNGEFDAGQQDVLIVNQFFHHVEKLEAFCATLQRLLTKDGVLLTSDVIGRNGHVPWPAVQDIVQERYKALPARQRFDRHFNATRTSYVPVDHSRYSNEGIRAQDVVGCLEAQFHFELFLTFGGAVMPFIERRLGFNFNPESTRDCMLIDDIASDDCRSLGSHLYPASNMIARLCHRGRAGEVVHSPVSPRQHIDMSLAQARGMSRRDG